MDWLTLVLGGAATAGGWWLSQGIYGHIQTRRARRQALDKDERVAAREQEMDERTRRRRAEARMLVLDDYAHVLREQVRELGGVPAKWPQQMTKHD